MRVKWATPGRRRHDCFLPLDQLGPRVAKAAGAVQLAHSFSQHDQPARFGGGRAHALQIQRGVDALRSELGADLGDDAPHVPDFGGLQQGLMFGFAHSTQVTAETTEGGFLSLETNNLTLVVRDASLIS